MNLTYLLLSYKLQRAFQNITKAWISCIHCLELVALHSLKAGSQMLFFKAMFALWALCSYTSD